MGLEHSNAAILHIVLERFCGLSGYNIPHVQSCIIHLTFMQLKSYAQVHNKPQEWKDADRGEVRCCGYDCVYMYDDDTCEEVYHFSKIFNTVGVGFVSINVFAFLLLIRLAPSYYQKFLQQLSVSQDNVKRIYLSVYWGTVIVVFLLCLWWFGEIFGGVILYHFHLNNYYSSSQLISLGAIFLTLLFTCIFCAWVIKRSGTDISIPVKSILGVFLCCCCCCCCSTRLKSKAIQTFGLCTLVAFVQLVVLYGFLFCMVVILNPTESLPILALCVSAFFCIIMVVSHLIYASLVYQSNHKRKRSVVPFLVQLFQIIAFVCFVFSIVLFYLFLLKAGVKLRGPGSFLASLIPSVALSAGAWYVKTKLLHTNSGAGAQNRHQLETPTDEEAGSDGGIVPGDDDPGLETVTINDEPGERTPLLQS